MKVKTFSRLPFKIPAIGQGAMGIGAQKENTEDAKRQVDALCLGFQCGMTFVDTAEGYAGGRSETIVGQAIRQFGGDVVVATKVSAEHLSCEGILRAADASLRRLEVETIDLYQIHWPNPAIPIAETLDGLRRLIRDKKIRAAGFCNYSLSQIQSILDQAPDLPVVSVQAEYNLFDRSVEEGFLPFCRERQLGFIAYSPLDQGYPAEGEGKNELLLSLSQKYKKSPAQIALAWLIRNGPVVAIPKALDARHIRENAGAADFELEAKDADEISRVFAMKVTPVPTGKIRVISGGQGNRQAYHTLEEARANALKFVPGPEDLAREIAAGGPVKPVRLIKSGDKSGAYEYDLIEGRLRYWAWVIAFGHDRPIPALCRGHLRNAS